MKVYVSFWQPPAVLFSFCRTVRGLLGWSVVLASITGASAYPFSDSFESGLGQWNAEGAWGLTSTRFASPTHAVTDSPGAFYTNRTDAALTLAGSLDLTSAVRPALGFLHQHALEPGYDFGRVEISTDGGVTWVATPLGAYTGHLSTMTREQIDLTPFAGLSNVRLRFRLVTDGSVVMDGWYIDDVVVAEAPAPVTLSATLTNRNSATLAWSASVEPDFTVYRLYRSLTPGVDWRTAHVVAELPNRAATHFTDITLGPKTTYYYRLAVVNAKGLLGLGNEIAVTTHPGMDYPFVDNGEAGPNMWIADPPWSLSDEDAASPTRAWSDSPGTNYVHGIGSQSLTLAAPLALAGHAVSPVLSFNHKYDFAAGDAGYVEISLNNGADWTSLGSFTGTSSNQWRRARYSLAAHTNAAAVLLRFRITTDTSANADGWHIDDISVAESPAVVPAPVLDEITSHTLRISWPAANDPFFAAYAVFRSTTPGVGINSTLAAWITNPATTSFVDTNLALDTLYYYRVYVVNAFGAFSPDSPAESSARTLNHPLPFRDGFEGALLGWTLTGTWGRNTNESHSGVACLSDSPGFNYANSSDSIAQTAVNLTGSRWPVLRFWDRFRLADNDWARVEVSTDGSSWTAVYGAAGVQAQWREQRIDLSPWKNQSNLRIRFHLWSDGGGTEDGWSIDDLAVEEHASGAVGLPFQETFESGLDRWLAASWAVDTNGPQGGGFAVRDTPAGRLNPDTRYELGLGGELDLRGAVNPQLVFWVRGQLAYRTRFRVQCSSDGGLNWGDFYGLNHDWNADWTRVQVSLQSLTNRLVRLRFVTWSEWGSAPAQDLWVDNISIEEPPAPVLLMEPVDITPASLRLTWSESAIPNFKAYRVYRSETPDVTEESTLVSVITNRTTTTFTDTGLMARKTYYYRIYVYNQNDTSNGSNLASAMTDGVRLPLVEHFETSQPGWTFTGTWTPWPGAGRNGTWGLVDSPSDYPNNASHYAQLAADLRGMEWPVLRFWDRHVFANNDWGRLFVSGDGGTTWTCVYGVSSVRTEWAEQSIDLSAWKHSGQVWLRFQVHTDGSTQDDGWAIDDLSLVEHTPDPAVYPFFEDFETGLDHWLHSSWTVDTNLPFAGRFAVRDTLPPRIPPDAQLGLVLNRELNLSNAVDPVLTFHVRGQLQHRTRFRAQVSTDRGASWRDLVGLNHDWNQPWTRLQVPLTDYANRSIRLRFLVWSEWSTAPDQDLFLDNIGVGEPAPGAPTLAAPANSSIVGVARPTLVVTNAIDYQGDPLSYRFEVYADPALTTPVAQVPAVASGPTTTAWTVDIDLPNNAQYWWRCRATDGTNLGPWMATATFFVNETNRPPLAPVIAGPPVGLVLTNLDVLLLWWPSAGDPDEGDRVVSYHLQVADHPSFVSPAINVTDIPAVDLPPGTNWVLSLPLNALPGAQNLVWRTLYYWRIRAQDQRGLSSAWSAVGPLQYGPPAPRAATLTGLRSGPGGQLTLEWTGAAGQIYVEFSPGLNPARWYTVAGPLSGTNWTFEPVPGTAAGFYRLRCE